MTTIGPGKAWPERTGPERNPKGLPTSPNLPPFPFRCTYTAETSLCFVPHAPAISGRALGSTKENYGSTIEQATLP
jgi:hypothetical protein